MTDVLGYLPHKIYLCRIRLNYPPSDRPHPPLPLHLSVLPFYFPSFLHPSPIHPSFFLSLSFHFTSPPPSFFFFFFFFFFCFLRLHLQHMEVPRQGVESELWLLAHATATAMPGPSHVCDLHQSSQQHWILNPLIEARDRTCNLRVPSQIVSAVPQWELPKAKYF